MNRAMISGTTIALTLALALGLAGSAEAVIWGQTGSGGTWNAYEVVTAGTTYDQARVNAAGQSFMGTPGQLAVLGSAAEVSFVGGIVGGNRWIGLTDATGTSSIDSFDYSTLGTTEAGNTSGQPLPTPGTPPVSGQRGYGFKWLNGEPFAYQAWGGGEPNDAGSEDAIYVRSDGFWNDHNMGSTVSGGGTHSNHNEGYVVEYETELASVPLQAGAAQLDPITGKYYERNTTDMTWDEARVAAENTVFGGRLGHLATISDADENAAVRMVGGTGNKWIGATDSGLASGIDGTVMPGPEGTFGWITGEPVVYTNWGGGEPSNSGGEDAAHIRGDGFWNDDDAGGSLDESDDKRHSVIEYEPLGGLDTIKYIERRAASSFGPVSNLADAQALMDLPSGHSDIAAEAEARVYAISFMDPEGGGGQGAYLRHPFLTDTSGGDDDFAVFASGEVRIPATDDWTFALAHDDHFQLILRDAAGTEVLNHIQTGWSHARVLPAVSLSQGVYDLELLWQERAGGAFLQLFAAQGNIGQFDPNVFALVGDEYNGGLEFTPEPGTLSLLALGAGIAAFRRRRRRKAA